MGNVAWGALVGDVEREADGGALALGSASSTVDKRGFGDCSDLRARRPERFFAAIVRKI
ncbi:MAG: hypothetical protein IJE97_05160 [Thermoguttaceae bacterium]|nr:hypothetical protein [Thermoguttaceae bacterium]